MKLIKFDEYKILEEKNFSEDAKTVSEYSPYFDHITVWNSRLFGSRDNIVAASCASTPFDWTMDTPEVTDAEGLVIGSYDATHAWYSTTQANIKATGDIVAIVAYDGHPIIFKDDYMHQINNNKNPFRIDYNKIYNNDTTTKNKNQDFFIVT